MDKCVSFTVKLKKKQRSSILPNCRRTFSTQLSKGCGALDIQSLLKPTSGREDRGWVGGREKVGVEHPGGERWLAANPYGQRYKPLPLLIAKLCGFEGRNFGVHVHLDPT